MRFSHGVTLARSSEKSSVGSVMSLEGHESLQKQIDRTVVNSPRMEHIDGCGMIFGDPWTRKKNSSLPSTISQTRYYQNKRLNNFKTSSLVTL
jgi:hypothetical protein